LFPSSYVQVTCAAGWYLKEEVSEGKEGEREGEEGRRRREEIKERREGAAGGELGERRGRKEKRGEHLPGNSGTTQSCGNCSPGKIIISENSNNTE
jgi:hypothetical protein